MGKGGKYLAQKAPVAKKKKKKNIFLRILIVILVILALLIGGAFFYVNHLLNLITRPDDIKPSTPAVTEAVEAADPQVESTAAEETVGETSPEDTWPQIASDENITNFMLVGQAAREGEEHLISDTMILCSINRETKTLTLTSLMRDMCLVWPKYVDTLGKEHTGNNRINMAYNMGYKWTGNKQDSMDVLESIVQHNFGVPVERTVEIDFGIFMKICDLLGGLYVEFDEAEIAYMQENYGDHSPNWHLDPGREKINGWQALCYARMRKVGHGDYDRTERQREVIIALLDRVKDKNILEIHKLFTEIMPMIVTDMTNKEITNYALEFIPMLKDLKVQSQRIPFDGNEVSVYREYETYTDNMIAPRDLKATAKQLQESIGMNPADAVN